MIYNKKLTIIITFFIALIVVIVVISGLTTNLKKNSMYYGEQFLEVLTTPEDLESTKYFRDVFYSGGTSQYGIEEYGDSLIKDYGYLMTDRAFDNAVSNRFIPWAELIRVGTNYNIKVDSVGLKKMREYEDGRVYYSYSISLKVSLADGKNETVQVSGDIVMIEENGSWIVDAFRENPDYRDLYKMLFF